MPTIHSDWPTASLGDGSEESHWTQDEFAKLIEVMVPRMMDCSSVEDCDALINEIREATNVPRNQLIYCIRAVLGSIQG